MPCCANSDKGLGEPLKYDPDFKGPLSKRSCTDLPCLFLFVTFLCAWGYVAYYAVQHGDLNRLLVPIDSDGRKCGVDSEVRDEPYLVFFNITECAKIDVPISGCSTTQTSQMIVEDILESWRMILVFIACSVLASLILIAMLRWIAKPLVWISIIGVITALSYGVYYSFRQYQQIRANPVAAHVNVSPNLSSLVNSWFKSDQTWLWILIALSVILIVLLLVVLVLRKRIVIAIALLKEGSK
uniref:Uncharacterized protein n=1 Tax=Anopheles coluzzii TaxID=1518534 RepID=A0A8W7Q1V8_ANOCL